MRASAKHAHGYARYLNSPEWGVKRKAAILRAGGACERCKATENLQAHHVTYERLGHERDSDLRVLCEPCHADEHGRASTNDRVISFSEAFEKENAEIIAREALEDEQEAILKDAKRRAERDGLILSSGVVLSGAETSGVARPEAGSQ